MIKFKHSGDFKHTERFFKRTNASEYLRIFHKYGKEGVNTLSLNTPIDSGETKNSWSYEIKRTKQGVTIIWNNSHIDDGAKIAILLQYGHGTRTGGYVQGRDYINPALRPIFDKIAEEIWKEVTKL